MCRPSIINSNGISLCLELLNICPSNYKSAPEISACERVQQKAAIALTRMCRDEEVGKVIVSSSGIELIIELFKAYLRQLLSFQSAKYSRSKNGTQAG